MGKSPNDLYFSWTCRNNQMGKFVKMVADCCTSRLSGKKNGFKTAI